MANLKITLDYFPHIERSRPMQMIGAEFGEKGDSVMWTIFEEIYIRGCGYFCEWNDDVALMFVQQPHLTVGVSVVSEILKAMIKRDILNAEMFEKYGILTSAEIQKTYFEAVKRRKGVKAIKEYLLINYSQISANVDIIELNADNIGENVNIKKQIKEKEIKRNKIKELPPKNQISLPLSDGQLLPITDEEINNFIKSYPDLNIRQELVSIKNWLEEKPEARKSMSGTRKLIERWLNKKSKGAQNGGSDKRHPKADEYGFPGYDGGKIL